MSVYSASTGLTPILKTYSSTEREKAKTAFSNKVRFEEPKKKRLLEVIEAAAHHNEWKPLNEYIDYLRAGDINDEDFITLVNEALSIVNRLDIDYMNLVQSILSLQWTKRCEAAINKYTDFCVNLLIAQTRYTEYCISLLIGQWIPSDEDAAMWCNGAPIDALHAELEWIHKLLDRITTAIPMVFNIMMDIINAKFPYYKKEEHVIAGYMHNLLWLLKYKPIFTDFVMHMLVQKLVILDVNAPRGEIQDEEDDDDTVEDNDTDGNEDIFEMDDLNNEDKFADRMPMNHPIARTLDICMEKMYEFLEMYKADSRRTEASQFFGMLLKIFDKFILPSHNTHHVQFLMFYFCTFKQAYAKIFLTSLLNKLNDPNLPAIERQSAVGYMASYLARAKELSLYTLKYFLKEMCDWAHGYINRSDQYRSNISLKANLVFFSVCQAVFYVIAFRSRNLTANRRDLAFLESLQLSGLVTNHLNPLRVCLPAVATAFAGVTRAYQLAYCHAILERNARRKLATVYANETATAEETLDTFFPFDPYLLKFSGSRIAPHYLQYQASDAEEFVKTDTETIVQVQQRKRVDSEMMDDTHMDEFLLAEKRQRLSESAKSVDRDLQFTYGLSPGFHK